METEFGWVIEFGESEVSCPSYWMGPSQNTKEWPFGMWSDDNLKAVRFAREQDADAVARAIVMWSDNNSRAHFRIKEHGWG